MPEKTRIQNFQMSSEYPEPEKPSPDLRCQISSDFERQCAANDGEMMSKRSLSAEQCVIECEKLDWCIKARVLIHFFLIFELHILMLSLIQFLSGEFAVISISFR